MNFVEWLVSEKHCIELALHIVATNFVTATWNRRKYPRMPRSRYDIWHVAINAKKTILVFLVSVERLWGGNNLRQL